VQALHDQIEPYAARSLMRLARAQTSRGFASGQPQALQVELSILGVAPMFGWS
jgi:hypothetical protein